VAELITGDITPMLLVPIEALDQTPKGSLEAAQVSASVVVQESCVVSPEVTDVGFAEMLTVGVYTQGRSPHELLLALESWHLPSVDTVTFGHKREYESPVVEFFTLTLGPELEPAVVKVF